MPTDLQQLFDFTNDDLVANRAGQLSARQQAKLAQDFRQLQVQQRLAWITYPIVVLLIVGYFAFVPALADAHGPVVIVIAFALFVALVVGWRLARRVLLRLLPPLVIHDTRVSTRAGRLTFRDDGEHRFVFLNDVELQSDVDAEQDGRLWQLEPDAAYVLYMADGRVVAVERVE